MLPVFAALLQVAGPPPLDEGWVFPTVTTKRATAQCPVVGSLTAEFRDGADGIRVIEVRGLGRRSSPADRRQIDEILRGLHGMTDVYVGCWGHVGGYIRIRGIETNDGVAHEKEAAFIWRNGGATRLPENAIYPSVASPRGSSSRPGPG